MAVTVAVIAGAIGAISAYGGALSGNKAAQKQKEQQRLAKQELNAKHISKMTQKLTPLFRQGIAGGLGPSYESGVAGNLASRGLTGTGIGESLRNASMAVPGIEAFRAALANAIDIQKARASLMAGAPPPQPRQNPLTGALSGFASGFLGAGGGGLMGGMGSVPGGATGGAGFQTAGTSSVAQSYPNLWYQPPPGYTTPGTSGLMR